MTVITRPGLQTAKVDDSAAREKLEGLEREANTRTRSLELREKEWDLAARVREHALSDAREQTKLLLTELANATAELRTNKVFIEKLEAQIEDYRRHIAVLLTRAVSRSRAAAIKRPARKKAKPKRLKPAKRPSLSKRGSRRRRSR